MSPIVIKVIKLDTVYFCSGSSSALAPPLAMFFKIAPCHSYYAQAFFRPRTRQRKNKPKQKQTATKCFGLSL